MLIKTRAAFIKFINKRFFCDSPTQHYSKVLNIDSSALWGEQKVQYAKGHQCHAEDLSFEMASVWTCLWEILINMKTYRDLIKCIKSLSWSYRMNSVLDICCSYMHNLLSSAAHFLAMTGISCQICTRQIFLFGSTELNISENKNIS
jgi:hypothetical protein